MLIIDLDIRAGDCELFSLMLTVRIFKYVLEDTREDTSAVAIGIILDVVRVANHRKGLSCSCLTIGEDAAIVALGKRGVLLKSVGRTLTRSSCKVLAVKWVRWLCSQTWRSPSCYRSPPPTDSRLDSIDRLSERISIRYSQGVIALRLWPVPLGLSDSLHAFSILIIKSTLRSPPPPLCPIYIQEPSKGLVWGWVRWEAISG